MQRAPGVFGGDIQVAERFFQALSTEPDGTRATVQEAINRLAKAYESTSAESKEAIKGMLAVQSRSMAGSVRMCALTWACSIFAFGDPFARHLCVLAAADPKQEVRAHSGAAPVSAEAGRGLVSSWLLLCFTRSVYDNAMDCGTACVRPNESAKE